MKRNLKILGLALAAVMAMSVMAAASASAAEFHAEKSVTLTASQTTTHKFTVNAGSTTCTGANFTGSQAALTSATQSVLPSYTGCTFIGVSTPIDQNGCEYKFVATTATTGTTTIVCPEGKTIVVTGPGCTVTVGSQGPLGGITYTNTGSGTTREVDVTANVTGIKYTQSGVFCTNGTFTNGTYTGTTLTTGENAAKEHVGIWVA